MQVEINVDDLRSVPLARQVQLLRISQQNKQKQLKMIYNCVN